MCQQELIDRTAQKLADIRNPDYYWELLKIDRKRHCEDDSPKQSIVIQYSGLLHCVRNDGKTKFLEVLFRRYENISIGSSKFIHFLFLRTAEFAITGVRASPFGRTGRYY